jgi:hypothetical protein
VLVGKGSKHTAGTKIHVINVANPSSKGVAIRITATGPFGSLKLKKGKLYHFDPKRNKLKRLKAITAQGVYVVVT